MDDGNLYTVLSVDDDLVRSTTAQMLEGWATACCPPRPRKMPCLLVHAPMDLVITEHAMPRMTGAQLVLRLQERWPRSPVITATGYAELPMGMQLDVPRLAKPYSLVTLAEIAHRTLNGRIASSR